MDALDLARLAADENRYRTAQKAAARQQAEDEMPGPVVYQGYDAGNARAIVRSLGNNPVEVGEIVTNGGLKPGQRVDASSSPGRVAIDAMPRVKPQPQLPEPKAQPQAKFAFLYNAVIEDVVSCFVGGFLPRSGVTPVSKDLPRQIHFLTRSTVIGGCKLESGPIELPSSTEYPLPDLPLGAFPPQGIVKVGREGVSVFYRDEFFRAKPIGYGLWLTIIDENFVYFSGTTVGDRGMYKTAQPYLTMTASVATSNNGSIFSGSGTVKSILIDSLTETVQVASISWQANAFVFEPLGELRRGTNTCSASGKTIILPGVERSFSFSGSSNLRNTFGGTSINNLYGTVMVDSTKTQSITWHKNGSWDTGDSNWYLFQGSEETRLDSTPHFSFELLDSERQIPEIGSYTLSGRTFFTVGTIVTGESDQREADLAFRNAIAGMAIIWSVKKDDGSCRRAYGRIASVRFEEISIISNAVSLVISIEKIIDVPYTFGATVNGTIFSNTGSVLDFLWAMGVAIENGSTKLGAGFSIPSAASSSSPIPTCKTNIALTHTNYHWQGNTIYIPENPPSSPNANADNYAEVWKIVDGKFVLQDRVKKGRRTKLLEEGESFQGAIAGTYIP